MTKRIYSSPTVELLSLDQSAILCTSDRFGAETERFDELGTLELN